MNMLKRPAPSVARRMGWPRLRKLARALGVEPLDLLRAR
jgi:hypothetical protein